MAFEIVWTKRAANGYDKIVKYLQENFTDREVFNFIADSDKFFKILKTHPEILQKTERVRNIRRGPLNPLTMITYQVKPISKQVVIINIRGARQRPIK